MIFYSLEDIRKEGFHYEWNRLKGVFNQYFKYFKFKGTKKGIRSKSTYDECFLAFDTDISCGNQFTLIDRFFCFDRYLENCKEMIKLGQMNGLLDNYDKIKYLAKQGKIRTIRRQNGYKIQQKSSNS